VYRCERLNNETLPEPTKKKDSLDLKTLSKNYISNPLPLFSLGLAKKRQIQYVRCIHDPFWRLSFRVLLVDCLVVTQNYINCKQKKIIRAVKENAHGQWRYLFRIVLFLHFVFAYQHNFNFLQTIRSDRNHCPNTRVLQTPITVFEKLHYINCAKWRFHKQIWPPCFYVYRWTAKYSAESGQKT